MTTKRIDKAYYKETNEVYTPTWREKLWLDGEGNVIICTPYIVMNDPDESIDSCYISSELYYKE